LRLTDEEFDLRLNATGATSITAGIDFFLLRSAITGQPVTGHGLISSSGGYDRNKEITWAAAIARLFRDRNNQPNQPARPTKLVVVPVDIFYRYIPGNPSWVSKAEILQNQTSGDGNDYAIILTGFTESSVFLDTVIGDIPTAGVAGFRTWLEELDKPSSKFQIKMTKTYQEIARIIERENGDINSAIQVLMSKKRGVSEEDARLLMAVFLLSRDPTKWQGLSEGDEGVGLFIVAPLALHQAIIRLTGGIGDENNYTYRADRGGYEAHLKPLSEISSGEPFDPNSYQKPGLSLVDFQRRIAPFLTEDFLA
jgi:hypothetical protein